MDSNLINGFIKHHRKMTMHLAAEHGLKLTPGDFDAIDAHVRAIVSSDANTPAMTCKPVLSGMADGWQGD